jgi:hypothetical protein
MGVPRRFSLGAMFIVTTIFGVIFGFMKMANAQPAAYFVVLGVFVVFGGAQAILFKGKKPRLASVVTGATGGLIYGLAVIYRESGNLGEPILLIVLFFLVPLVCVIFGCVLGYIFGTLIASIFLFCDRKFRQQEELAEAADKSRKKNDIEKGIPNGGK